MRISRVTLDLEMEDINSMLTEFAPDAPLHVTSIDEEGIHGHIRFLLWNIDFVAAPYSRNRDELNLDITAHKLVAIPNSLIERQLREAVKDAPEGIDVISQTLRVKFTPLLAPLGLSLEVEELQPYDDFVRITLSGIHAQNVAAVVNRNQDSATTFKRGRKEDKVYEYLGEDI